MCIHRTLEFGLANPVLESTLRASDFHGPQCLLPTGRANVPHSGTLALLRAHGDAILNAVAKSSHL